VTAPVVPLTGRPGAKAWLKIRGGLGGFVRLSYDEDGRLANVARVPSRDGRASGLQLYFHGEPPSVTFKTERGLSGQVWSSDAVSFGTVWDDDGASAPAARRVSLPEWLSECLQKITGGGKIEASDRAR
jgi:hypothetical protein